MAMDIILDDWVLPGAIELQKKADIDYEADMEKLEKSILQNQEVIRRIRSNKKYNSILQEVQ